MAKNNIRGVEAIVRSQPILIIFDRGYPSIELVDYMETHGISYLFRLSSNDYKKERKSMTSCDEPVKLQHTYARLKKICKNHPERVDALRAKRYTDTRIISSILDSGAEITLMTNLPFTFGGGDIQKLYLKRWEIEKKYHTLKNKLKFESVTGKATLYVYQDFWAQVFVYNMIQDILNVANRAILPKSSHRKHPLRINENITIGLFKAAFIAIFTAFNINIRRRKLFLLYSEVQRFTVPIRNLKSANRVRNFSNKFMENQKFSF